MTRPKISVIIPVYNRELLVRNAVQSVLDQSFVDFELVVVDDASTDETVGEILSFHDDRIRVVRKNQNGGNASARNIGIQESKAELITFLDSDDSFDRDFLEKVVSTAEQFPDIFFFWAGVQFVNSEQQFLRKETWTPKGRLPGLTFFEELRIGTNNGLTVRRAVTETVGFFDENLKASVDRDFLLRISQNFKGDLVRDVFVNVLIGTHDSVRKNYSDQAEAYNHLIKKYKSIIYSKSRLKAWWLHKALWLNLYSGNKMQAFNYLKSLGFPIKSSMVFSTFLLLPNESARKIHKMFAKKGISRS
ncbi:glycosyltransferase family 2 protein [Negadavirga shengliensis]|uniref:Glycosyltransferase family 2 protein n=1 Tax=Negadavirga shengliensis TaxID=1389218 RepID=A0ABV9T576_9BACT